MLDSWFSDPASPTSDVPSSARWPKIYDELTARSWPCSTCLRSYAPAGLDQLRRIDEQSWTSDENATHLAEEIEHTRICLVILASSLIGLSTDSKMLWYYLEPAYSVSRKGGTAPLANTGVCA